MFPKNSSYKKWKDAEKEWGPIFKRRWPNFSIKEVAQRGTGHAKGNSPVIIVPAFLDKVQALRNFVGPLSVTSWYRSPDYNAKISSTGKTGPHTTGRALDVPVSGGACNKLIYFAHKVGFTGIGVEQKGDYKGRFIHLDDLGNHETKGPRPHMWSY